MGYSTENRQNSTSVAMFASVGLHAVLFVSMAFFPATSETVKKPLRIVNLLPPDQLPSGTPSTQAKTSTLQDILNNPLPDLSAGFPPLGNTSQPPNLADENASSYVGNSPGRVNTALNWTNPPVQSFNTNPSGTSSAGSSASAPPQTSSTITPAPSSPQQEPTPNSTGSLPALPDVASAFPSPFPNNSAPSNAPSIEPSSEAEGTIIGALTPDVGENIPASRQRVIPIVSESVAFNYPEAACRDQLQGTATLSYYRQPDGSYVAGSENYEIATGHTILNDAALSAVINAPAAGTGSYQRYSSRFDFIYSDEVCAAKPDVAPSTTADPLTPIEPGDEQTSEAAPTTDEFNSEGTDTNAPKEAEKDSNTQDAPVPQSESDNSKAEKEGDRTPPEPAPTPVEPAAPEPPASSDTPNPPVSAPSAIPTPQPEAPANQGSAADLLTPAPAAPAPEPPIAPAEPLPSVPAAEPSPPPPAPAPEPPAAEPAPPLPEIELPAE